MKDSISAALDTVECAAVAMQLPHKKLHGRERLHNVVNCLSRSCPWTKSITSDVMLGFLESEVHELKDELSLMKKDVDNMQTRDAIVSEVGDILFDALMLEMVIRREYRLDVDEAWQVAAEKVERRTPYVEDWGDGVTKAKTIQDTEEIWQEVKRKEKAAAAAAAKENETSIDSVLNGPNVTPTDGSRFTKKINVAKFWRKLKNHDRAVNTAALAFTLGVVVTRLMMGRPR